MTSSFLPSPHFTASQTTTPGRAFMVIAAALFAPLAVLIGPVATAAQQSADNAEDWDVTLARGETREISFTTDEGTWLSLDASPDGRWILFDLLGHIYRLPASGGNAQSLTQDSGVAVNYHPRFSPDGTSIAFISDREGQNNLWIMDADGSNPRAVFTSLTVRASMPAWTPDGEYLVVRRDEITGPGQQGSSGIWMYHRDGGTGVELVDDGAATWPTLSPDGRHVFFQHRSVGRDALRGHYQIRRLDRLTGDVVDITAGNAEGPAASRVSSGGAFAPEVSPDGRWLAFGRHLPDGLIEWKGHRFGPRTALWVRDLETGAERVVMDPVSIAIESGSKSLRTLPGYAWSADASSIVIAQGGKVRRLDVSSGDVATLPFQADVQRTISEMAYTPFRITDEPFAATFLRWHTSSPGGDRLAFQAVGRIWTTDLPSGTPRRVTPADFGPQEFGPAWSPDGQWIAFTSWDDVEGGHLWRVPSGGGAPQQLTEASGEYVHPSWSADGSEIVVARGSGATARGRTVTHNPWWDVVRVPAAGGQTQLVTRVGLPEGMSPGSVARRAILHPSYGPDGRIFYPQFVRTDDQTVTVLMSVEQDGGDRREHMELPAADEITPSPDGRWVAFQEGDNAFVVPMPWMGAGDERIRIDKRNGTLPVRALSTEGGLFVRWRSASVVEFGSGTTYYRHDVAAQRTDTFTVALQVPRATPAGSVALTGARIVTLNGDEIIEQGTLVVEGSRIACVGECDVTRADSVIDVAGSTIIPGLVDMHSHHYREHRGYRPRRDYESAIYLAYGVTTSLDNSMWSQNIFPTAEMVEAGQTIGPRTFSTGDPLYRGDAARQNELSSFEVAEQNVVRLKSWGAVSIKQYMQPRRDQRQWVSHAARAHGLMVTAEGGDLFYNLSMIMDGQTAWEHPVSYIPLYSDFTRFMGQAGAYYSPTFVVAGPGPANIDYFFAESDVWKDQKHRRWMPWRQMAGHLRRRVLRPKTDYSYPMLAQGLADLIAEGGYGAIGSHGEHHGLAAQWEVWMAASAMEPLQALRVASLHGARFLGADRDLGSLEAGKLADLLVLNANPLDDIRATADIRFVMKGGVLYVAETLDQVWPEQRPFGPYPWLDDDALADDVRTVGHHDPGGS